MEEGEKQEAAMADEAKVAEFPTEKQRQLQTIVRQNVQVELRKFWGVLDVVCRLEVVLEAWKFENYSRILGTTLDQMKLAELVTAELGEALGDAVLKTSEMWLALSDFHKKKGEGGLKNCGKRWM